MKMSNKQLLNLVMKTELRFFIQKVFSSIAPGDTYLDNWHIQAIAYHLQQC